MEIIKEKCNCILNNLMYKLWNTKKTNKGSKIFCIFKWGGLGIAFILLFLSGVLNGVLQDNFFKYINILWKQVIFLIFVIIFYIASYIVGKTDEYDMLVQQTVDEKEYRKLIVKNARRNAVIAYAGLALIFFLENNNYQQIISLDHGTDFLIGLIEAFCLLILITYPFLVGCNSIFMKCIAMIGMSVYIAFGIYGMVVLRLGFAILLRNSLFKIVFITSYVMDTYVSTLHIIIALTFTIVMATIYAFLIPRYQIDKGKYALQIMNILVLSFTFLVFISAKDIVMKKADVKQEIVEQYSFNTMEQAYRNSQEGMRMSEDEMTNQVDKAKELYQDVLTYVEAYSASDIRDISYFILFPYGISMSLLTLIWKYRTSKEIDNELVEEYKFSNKLLINNINKNVLNRIRKENDIKSEINSNCS
jgi:hypothetical protein